MEVDRADIPQGWYDLVVLGHGWEAIGAAWYARGLGARVAIVPGAPETQAAKLKVPLPSCQWWNLNQPGSGCAAEGRGRVCWQPPAPPFVEGLPMGGQALPTISTDKALGQLAASGVAVFRGPVCFQAPDVLEVHGQPIAFRKVLLAFGQQQTMPLLPSVEPAELTTPEKLLVSLGFGVAGLSGSETGSPDVPKPPGVSSGDSASFLGTGPQQPLFPLGGERKRLSQRVAIVGSGPEECFWAQWLARQGCQVHLLPSEPEILPAYPPEIRQWVQLCLLQEGVRIYPQSLCQHLQPTGQAKVLLLARLGHQEKLVVDFLMAVPETTVAAPGLQLEAAGVRWDPKGIFIDSNCRTTNRRILAAGSVCGCQFRCPRIAWSMIRWAVAKALGHRPPKQDWLLRFQCFPMDPPIFWLGQTAAEAQQQCWPVQTYRVEASCPEVLPPPKESLCHTQTASSPPSAPIANQPEAFLQIHVRPGTGRIIGAVVGGPWAHELADMVAFLIQQKISLPKWALPTGCVSPSIQLLAEAAHLARQDHTPHWWDLPLENLHRLWQKWRSRRPPEPEMPPSGSP